MPLSKPKVLAHLAQWTAHPNLLVASVTEGLVTAINRGDFDDDREEE